jgi:hypothetical protein
VGLLDRFGRSLLILQGGLWASTAHNPDFWHLWINSFPLLLLVGRSGGRSFSQTATPGWRRGLAILFSVAALGVMGGSVVRNISDARATRVWLSELRSHLGNEDFLLFTFLPSLYIELKVENPYYNSLLLVRSHPREHFERNVAILSEQQPRYVILDYGSVQKYGHSLDIPVDRFIREHYSRAWPHGGGTLETWERSDAPRSGREGSGSGVAPAAPRVH